MCVYEHVCTIALMWRSEDNFMEPVLFPHLYGF